MPAPFVILCEHAHIAPLAPGESVSAATKLFWSSEGFAFERPGRYRVDVALLWSAQGVPVGVQGGVDVFVDYPAGNEDNQAAGLVMHPEVGKWVAIGGGAYHLQDAWQRLEVLAQTAGLERAAGAGALMADVGDGAAPSGVLAGFANLLPDPGKLAELHPEFAADASPRTGRLSRTGAAAAEKGARKGKGRRPRR